MHRLLVAVAFLFALSCQASAQNLRVTETWYGLYTVEGVQTIEDPRSPSGKRRVGGKIVEPRQNSTRIPHTPGSYFGFGYVLSSPSGANTAQVRHVTLIPPPGLIDSSGRTHTRLESDLNLRVGSDLFIGVSMGESTAIGTWTMQVWHEGRVLIERKFELYRP